MYSRNLLVCFCFSCFAQTSVGENLLKFESNVTWTDAVKQCKEHGMELACASSPDNLLWKFGKKRGEQLNLWVRSVNCSTPEEFMAAEIHNNFPDQTKTDYSRAPKGKLPFACASITTSTERSHQIPSIAYDDDESSSIGTTSTSTSSVGVVDGRWPQVATGRETGCPPTYKRGMLWESHSYGIVYQQCPNSATGFAKWNCAYNGKWFPDHPDLSECQSEDMQTVLDELSHNGVLATSGLLEGYAKSAQYGGDLVLLVYALENVTSGFEREIHTVTHEEKSNVSLKFSQNVTAFVSRLLENMTVWQDLPEMLRMEFASKVLNSTENVGFYLAQHLKSSTHQQIANDNLFLQALNKPRGFYGNQTLTLPVNGSLFEDGVMFPAGFENDIIPSDVNETTAIFIRYKDLRNILPDEGSQENGSNLNSAVISLSFGTVSGRKRLSTPIRLRFNQIFKSSELEKVRCVFWNFQKMIWDEDGCNAVRTSMGTTVCECTHLTNFALLMDIHGVMPSLSTSDKNTLRIITIIGCSLSIVCLSLCVLIHTVYRSLNAVRTTIIRNISLSLLMAEILLLAGMKRIELKVLCAVVAGLMHFSFLSAFCWMLLEAFYLYIVLYKIFPSSRSYYNRYYIFGYGVPLIIVVCSVAVRPTGYVRDDYCWLSSSDGFMWSYTAPVLFILVVNGGALIFAVKTATAQVSSKKPLPQATKTFLKSTLILLPLLGLTWVPGFLFYDRNTVVWAYIFTLLNVCQGVAIFVCHCLLNQKSRDCIMKSIYKILVPLGFHVCSSSHVDANAASTTPHKTKSTIRSTGSLSYLPNPSNVFRSASNSYKLQSNGSKAAQSEVCITSSEDGQHKVVLRKISLGNESYL